LAEKCECRLPSNFYVKVFALSQSFLFACFCAGCFAERGVASSLVESSSPDVGTGGATGSEKTSSAVGKGSAGPTNSDFKNGPADPSAPRIQKLVDGRIVVGLVTVDPEKRQISFPAKVNQRSGLVEYAVVTSKGKVHESVFVTEASATHIHMAALLLKFAAAEGLAEPLKLAVEVEWELDGSVRRESMDRFIVHTKDAGASRAGSTLPREAWNYAGSLLNDGVLVAEAEGSVIALITDEAALIQNPRAGRMDDELHAPNPDLLLEQGSSVVVHLVPPGAREAK
jgi:hypothetical protein